MKFLLPLLLVLGLGCASPNQLPKVPDSIPATGTSVDKAKAHVESASDLVTQATPESNPTGQALLAAAGHEQGKALSELDKATVELNQIRAERQQLEAQVNAVATERAGVEAELTKVKSGWGYRLQQFVLRMFWLIVSLTALHFVLGIAALFVTGPFGNILAKAGAVLNPFAWFQTLRDNHYFNKKCPEATKP